MRYLDCIAVHAPFNGFKVVILEGEGFIEKDDFLLKNSFRVGKVFFSRQIFTVVVIRDKDYDSGLDELPFHYLVALVILSVYVIGQDDRGLRLP